MRRFAHCLILLMAPSQLVWADDAFNQSQRGACVYSDSSASRPVSTARSNQEASSSAAALRGSHRSSGESHGGGGSEEDLMQRMRAPRWHSFLPGMFR